MNQEQRKFLIAAVEKESHRQKDNLSKQLPEKPSLNNYLIAAFLDGTVKFADLDTLKQKMRDTVLKFGTSDKLIQEHERFSSSRRNQETDVVQVSAADLFVIPKNYLEALAEYEKKRVEIQTKIDELEATQNTIVMKIQIGSATSLEKLVGQIDSIGDLNFVNSQLTLGAGEKPKQLERDKS